MNSCANHLKIAQRSSILALIFLVVTSITPYFNFRHESQQFKKGRYPSMQLHSMREHSRRITRFVTVQLIALVGWIIVQSSFSLSPLGRAIPFVLTMVIETIWWIATLVIMFLLFRQEYDRFVQTVLELEDANRRLRKATNDLLLERRNQSG
jgi:p-aminobenzoyl-glutamate transporter AbgT